MISFPYRLLPLLLLLLFIISANSYGCAQRFTYDQMHSGTLILYYGPHPSKDPKYNAYFLNPHYVTTKNWLRIIVSTNSDFIMSYSESPFSFSLRGYQFNSQMRAIIFFKYSKTITFTHLKARYFMSSNSYFSLGMIYTGFQYFSSPYTYTHSTTISDYPIDPSSAYSIAVYISGMNLPTATKFDISIKNPQFNPSTQTITFKVFIKNLKESLTLMQMEIVFIIMKQNPQFYFGPSYLNQSYSVGGLISLAKQQHLFTTEDIQSQIYIDLLRIYQCKYFICPKSCIPRSKCVSLGCTPHDGLRICDCSAGMPQLNDNNQNPVTSNNILCGVNQVLTNNQCTCDSGYVIINGICSLVCGENKYFYQGVCVCVPGYVYDSQTSQCSIFSSTSTSTSSGISVCGVNELLINGICSCVDGYGKINGVCKNCSTNSFANYDGNCVCYSGYEFNPSTQTCDLFCLPNFHSTTQGTCICNEGYQLQGGQCLPSIDSNGCPGGAVYDAVGNCVCPKSLYMDSITNWCSACNTNDRQILGDSCVCAQSYFPTSSGCGSCPLYSLYNSSVNACVCISGYTMSNNECTFINSCLSNQIWNSYLQRCQCVNSNEYLISGACSSCPANSRWNGASCQCSQGFTFSGSICSAITPICSAGSHWDANNQQCICYSGYYLIGGVCTVCTANSYYVSAQGTCICNIGYWGDLKQCSSCHSSCASCNGPNSNQCLTCTYPKTLSNGNCTQISCPPGYILNGGQCTLMSTSSGSTQITCSPGYILSGGQCVLMSTSGRGAATLSSKVNPAV